MKSQIMGIITGGKHYCKRQTKVKYVPFQWLKVYHFNIGQFVFLGRIQNYQTPKRSINWCRNRRLLRLKGRKIENAKKIEDENDTTDRGSIRMHDLDFRS